MNKIKEILGYQIVFKTLTWGAKQEALRKATEWRRIGGGDIEPDVDPWKLNDYMLLYSVEKWNIVDDDGKPVPLSVDGLHTLSPRLVEALIIEMHRLNGLSLEERKKS